MSPSTATGTLSLCQKSTAMLRTLFYRTPRIVVCRIGFLNQLKRLPQRTVALGQQPTDAVAIESCVQRTTSSPMQHANQRETENSSLST